MRPAEGLWARRRALSGRAQAQAAITF
jgi:hypothetical protein